MPPRPTQCGATALNRLHESDLADPDGVVAPGRGPARFRNQEIVRLDADGEADALARHDVRHIEALDGAHAGHACHMTVRGSEKIDQSDEASQPPGGDIVRVREIDGKAA